jgi:zinc protease
MNLRRVVVHAVFAGLLPALVSAQMLSNASPTNRQDNQPLTLPNGFRVLLHGPFHDAYYTEAVLVVRAGLLESAPNDETARVAAEALTAGRRSPLDPPIRTELAWLGATIDSTVGREVAVFRFAVPTMNTVRFLRLLGLLVSRPIIPVEQWADALDRAHRASEAEHSDMWWWSNQQLKDMIWNTPSHGPQRHPLTTRVVDRQVLNDFWHRAYAPDKMVLSVWGDIDPGLLAAEVQHAFGNREGSAGPTASATNAEPELSHDGAVECDRVAGASPPSLLIGLGAHVTDDQSFYGTQIAAHILGASNNSRLQRRLREQEGVVYTVEAAAIPVGSSQMLLRITSQTEQIEATREIIVEEVRRLLQQPVHNEELTYARAILRSRLKLDAQSMRERYYQQSLTLLMGRQPHDPNRADPLLDSFTPQTLQRVLRTAIRDETLSTLVVSSHPESFCEAAYDAR